MAFTDIRDQDVPLRLLRNMIARDRIPNGLLFWGPSGVGKRLTALELAKAMNCEAEGQDACGQCLPCKKIAHSNHPDVQVVIPVKKSRNIDVGAIEGIVEMVALKPFESDWRIFIIMDAERMRGPAQNHLLKTLEEPLGQTLFILITEFPQLLLPTIRSRCQRIRFGALRPDTVLEILCRDRELPREAAEAAASLSQGQISRAFDLVDTEKRSVVLDIVGRLSAGEDPLAVSEEFGKYLSAHKSSIEAGVKTDSDPVDKQEISKEDRERIKEEQMALVDALCRRDIMEHLYLFETWYRDALVYRATGEATHVLNRDQEALLESAGPLNDPISAISKARLYLERFLNEERVFRDLFFALAP
jgi:DNA polymerase-3 subunit delta'